MSAILLSSPESLCSTEIRMLHTWESLGGFGDTDGGVEELLNLLLLGVEQFLLGDGVVLPGMVQSL